AAPDVQGHRRAGREPVGPGGGRVAARHVRPVGVADPGGGPGVSPRDQPAVPARPRARPARDAAPAGVGAAAHRSPHGGAGPMTGSGTEGGRLRILHVSEVHWGGVVTLLEHFTAEQVRAGHEVHLLAPAAMRTFDGVAQRTWRISRRRACSAATALRALRRAVREGRPDVLHLHSFVAGFLGRPPGRRRLLGRVPLVYQPHAWSFDLFTRKPLGNAVRRWERWAARTTAVLVANCADEVAEGRSVGVDVPAQ